VKIKLIKELIKAKGLTLKEVAGELGLGYHLFEKVVIRAHSKTKNGIKFYETRHVREKIAAWLGYPYDLIWGPNADYFLKKLIAEEIERQVKDEKDQRLKALGFL